MQSHEHLLVVTDLHLAMLLDVPVTGTSCKNIHKHR